jgi:hypothetical protein
MSMIDYERAKAFIQATGEGGFIGQRQEEWVAEAERQLGITFPPTYRRFLRELGCGGFRSEEFYGIVDADLLRGPVPNGVWLTLDERQCTQLAPSFVIVQSGGDGSWYAIDTAQRNIEGESPVLILDVNCHPYEVVAEDFGRFFLDRILFVAGDRAVGRVFNPPR